MYSLLLTIAFATSLIIILSILVYIRRADSLDSMKWLKQHGKSVTATVTQVKAEQEWKYGSRYSQWNTWEGRYERERVWQTSHYVVAQWEDPQTKQGYAFRVDVGSPAVAREYALGSPVHVIFNPKHPERCYVELGTSYK